MDRRAFLSLAGSVLMSALVQKNMFAEQKMSVYMTIDDGPNKSMDDILRLLSDRGQYATFFLIGSNIKRGCGVSLAERALREGHTLGNHSYTHPSFSRISLERAYEEIKRTRDILGELYEKTNRSVEYFFRFPYGDSGSYMKGTTRIGTVEHRRAIRGILHELGYPRSIFWDVDTLDWRHYAKNPSLRLTLNDVLSRAFRARPDDIVLCHDSFFTARRFLPRVFEHFDSRVLPLSLGAKVFSNPCLYLDNEGRQRRDPFCKVE